MKTTCTTCNHDPFTEGSKCNDCGSDFSAHEPKDELASDKQTKPPTAEEYAEFGAKALGLELEKHPTGCGDVSTPEHKKHWIWMELGVFKYFYKDFTPHTKIEQAMLVAFKEGCHITFYPQSDGSIQLPIDGRVSTRQENLTDCARKIMDTLYELEVGE